MQQRKTPEEYFIEDQENQKEQGPYREKLPKAFEKPPEAARFDEPEADWTWYYWLFIYFTVGIIIGLMGVAALMEMFKAYSWLLALSWTSTAVMGIGGLALIQKYWIRR